MEQQSVVETHSLLSNFDLVIAVRLRLRIWIGGRDHLVEYIRLTGNPDLAMCQFWLI